MLPKTRVHQTGSSPVVVARSGALFCGTLDGVVSVSYGPHMTARATVGITNTSVGTAVKVETAKGAHDCMDRPRRSVGTAR